MDHRRLFVAARNEAESDLEQRFNNYTFNEGLVYKYAYLNGAESDEYMKYVPTDWDLWGGTFSLPDSQASIYDWGEDWAGYTTGGRFCCILELRRRRKRIGNYFYLVQQDVDFSDKVYLTFNILKSIAPNTASTTSTYLTFDSRRVAQTLDVPVVVMDTIEGESLPKGIFGEYFFDLNDVYGSVDDWETKKFSIGMAEAQEDTAATLFIESLWLDNFKLWSAEEMPILNPSFEVGDLYGDGLNYWTLYSQGDPTITTTLDTDFATSGVRSLRLSQRPRSQSTTIDGWDDYMSMAGISQTVDVTDLRTISWNTRYTTAGVVALEPFAILDGTSIAVSNRPVAGWTTHSIDVTSRTGSLELIIGNGVYNTATAGVGYVTQYDNFLTSSL